MKASNDNARSAVIASALLCALGGWLGSPLWAALIGGAAAGVILAAAALVDESAHPGGKKTPSSE